MVVFMFGKRGVFENGGGLDSEIIFEVVDVKDFFVLLMKEESFIRICFLVVEIVVNILVNKEVFIVKCYKVFFY